jgi:hypothetical protein
MGRTRGRVVGLALIGTVVGAIVFISLRVKPLRGEPGGNTARTEPRSPSSRSVGLAHLREDSPPGEPLGETGRSQSRPSGFARARFDDLKDVSRTIADIALRRVDEFERLQIDAFERETALRLMQVAHDKAKSARVRAETALTEYEQGTARQDEAKAAGEVFEARRNLERAQNQVQEQKDQLARNKTGASPDAIAALAASILIKQHVRDAEARENEAAGALDLAESRQRELLEQTKPARVKELRAIAEKLRTEEKALKTTIDLEQSKHNRVQKAALEQALSDADKRLLALLDRGIAIEEQIDVEFEGFRTGPNDSVDVELKLQKLVDQLEGVVVQARLMLATDAKARLKPRIKAVAKRYPAATTINHNPTATDRE